MEFKKRSLGLTCSHNFSFCFKVLIEVDHYGLLVLILFLPKKRLKELQCFKNPFSFQIPYF